MDDAKNVKCVVAVRWVDDAKNVKCEFLVLLVVEIPTRVFATRTVPVP